MQIGNTHPAGVQQTLSAAIDVSRSVEKQGGSTLTQTRIEGQISFMRQDGDSLQLTEIDFSFARTVLENSLQDRLDAAFENEGIDLSTEGLLQGGVDLSPEATAGRIIDFATGFFGLAAQEGQEDELARLENFTSLIRGAVQEGFGQARDFLSAFQPSDEVTDAIDRTFEMVMAGIASFAAERRAALEEAAEEASAEEAPVEEAPVEEAPASANMALDAPAPRSILTARS